jgi:hypothetical protein
MCTDLACSLYLRGKKDAGPGGRIHESLALPEKIERTTANLTAFLGKVRDQTRIGNSAGAGREGTA